MNAQDSRNRKHLPLLVTSSPGLDLATGKAYSTGLDLPGTPEGSGAGDVVNRPLPQLPDVGPHNAPDFDNQTVVPPSPAESVRLPAIGALKRTSSLPAARRGGAARAQLAISVTPEVEDVEVTVELTEGEPEARSGGFPTPLPSRIASSIQFRSAGAISGSLCVPFGVQVEVAGAENLELGSGMGAVGEGIVLDVSVSDGAQAVLTVKVRRAKKKELSRMAQEQALVSAMERGRYSSLLAQISRSKMRKVEAALIDQASRMLKSMQPKEGTFLTHKELNHFMKWKHVTIPSGAEEVVQLCDGSADCPCNVGSAQPGELCEVLSDSVSDALHGVAPGHVAPDQWLFQALVKAALAAPEGCGKFLLTNEDRLPDRRGGKGLDPKRNQSPTAIVGVLERDNQESAAGKAFVTRKVARCVTAIQLNFHPNHKQHRDIYGAGQKGGINCTCSFMKCTGTVCYSIGSSRQILCETITDSRSKYETCGEECTGRKTYKWMHSGSAMHFNAPWHRVWDHLLNSKGQEPSEGGDAGHGETACSLCAEAAVDIVWGTYKGRRGHVVKVMSKKVEVELDDGRPLILTTPSLAIDIEVLGMQGTISSITEKMYHIELDSGGTACVKQAFVTAFDRGRAGRGGQAFQRVSGDSESLLPSDSTGEAPLAQWLWSGIKTITIQAPHEKEEECFITCYFGQRRLPPLEEALSRSIKNPPSATPTRTLGGQEYHLLSTKVLDDGTHFWGGKKKKLRMMYVAQGEHSLQHELERLADFPSIPLSCKIASRLSLCKAQALSSGTVYKSTAEHFEDIPEPQPSTESGGCGFIPQELLYGLVAGRPNADRITSIQVRIFGPRLGVLKGMLTLRRNIQKIQLPPSMRKVGPSKVCSDEFVYVVVTQTFPSSTSFELAKCLLGTEKRQAMQSLLKQQGPKLSDMVRRLLQGLGVGQNDMSAFEKERPRQEAFLVGVTDPSFAIPEGQVFIPDLIDHVPLTDGVPSVFVSRCPCIEPQDGKLLRVLVERPSDMSWEDWNALRSRPFGEIIFSGKGRALPGSIAEGDLDGDRYYVCWHNCIVSSVSPCQEEPTETIETGPKSQQSGTANPATWLARAQEHMLKSETIHEKDLIGRLYKAAEKIADESERGIRDPDARTLFIAYRQAIDHGKHGGEIDIPEHLQKRFRL
ncbi:unnamed protein product [Symbiodinium microadriaticum]|nr:unnamed protein product [Symbiodinium microadriaticum]